jgi:hypothetical protein
VASVRNNAGREALQNLPAAVEGKFSVPTLDVNCHEDIDSLRRDLKVQPLDLLLINAASLETRLCRLKKCPLMTLQKSC